MALTNQQLLSLGFKPSVRGRGGLSKTKKYDSLVLALNETDFLYTGYNPYKKQVNYKTIWKSFKDSEGNRITYQVVNIADTGFKELQEYIYKTILLKKGIEIFEKETIMPVELSGNSEERIHSTAFTNTTPNSIDPSDQVLEDPSENTLDVTTEIPSIND